MKYPLAGADSQTTVPIWGCGVPTALTCDIPSSSQSCCNAGTSLSGSGRCVMKKEVEVVGMQAVNAMPARGAQVDERQYVIGDAV